MVNHLLLCCNFATGFCRQNLDRSGKLCPDAAALRWIKLKLHQTIYHCYTIAAQLASALN